MKSQNRVSLVLLVFSQWSGWWRWSTAVMAP